MQQKIFFLACFFISIVGSAQQYPFIYYTPNDGLVNSRVRNIKQDSKGRIYFITYGGLSVYDGVRFINYRQQDGLANELVNDIAEVSPDSLLVATNTQKLNTLVNGKIGVYKTADNFYPLINRFLKSTDGNWYVATDNGFFILSGNKFVRLPFADSNGNDLSLFLDQFIEWKKFFLIIPWKAEAKKSLILYNRLTHQITDACPAGSITSMAKDSSGQIWITTPEGIKLINPETLQNGKIDLINIPTKYKSIENIKNVSLFFDSKNNLWLYNNDLLERVSTQAQVEAIASGRNLKAGNLTTLFEDRENIMWMATDGNGAIKIKGTDLQFINELLALPLRATTILQKKDTTWLFNVTDNSVYRICKNIVQSFHLTIKMFHPETITVSDRKIFIADQKKVITIADKNNQAFYQHPMIITENVQQGVTFGCGVVDKHGSIIQLLNKNDTAFYLIVIRDNKVVMQQPITSLTDEITIDKNDNLWFATRNDHLMVFSIHPDRPSQYLQLVKDYSKELPFSGARSIAADTNNNIWVGTRYNGLLKIQFDGLRIRSVSHFTAQNGLTDNFIYTLHVDEKNNIWVGTQTGLDKIFLKNGQPTISNISRSNNLFQAINKIVNDNDHTTWALTNEGSVIKVSSASVQLPSAPPVLISIVKVNGQPIINSACRFSYDKNNFLFNVATASFTDEKSIRYSYLLTGSGNSKWSDPSPNASLNFINLPPGNYTLQVKALFPDAMYDTQESSLSFIISPPWWQTWWFRIFAGLLITGILFLVIRFYYRRKLEQQRLVLEKQQAIEKERTRIATDMHDDLGAGLSRIKFLSETIGIKKQKEQPIEEDITKIREYSHEMIEKMGEIVWALNEKNDSLSDLLSYTRSYAVEYLSQNGIACTVEAPEHFPANFVSGEFRRNIYLTIKEALHNVVKHSQASVVNILINTNGNLNILIKDNGIGFDKNDIRPFSNGLSNMESRIKEMGGELNLVNKEGTTVSLSIPLPA